MRNEIKTSEWIKNANKDIENEDKETSKNFKTYLARESEPDPSISKLMKSAANRLKTEEKLLYEKEYREKNEQAKANIKKELDKKYKRSDVLEDSFRTLVKGLENDNDESEDFRIIMD